MARQIEDFMLVWQALSGDALSQGWQTLALPSAGACTLLAGRHFPGQPFFPVLHSEHHREQKDSDWAD